MANIYLSSSFEDLKDYRKAVYDALRELRHDVRQMEHYTASEERPLRECLADVIKNDVYVGVFAWRYGHVPKDDELNPKREAITALEYRAAKAHGIPTFVFLTEDNASWSRKWIDKAPKNIDALRKELKRDLVVGQFATPDELARKVSSAVTNWEKRQAPVKVVEALPGKPDEERAVDNATWGVVATGATKSPYTGAGVTVGLVATGVDTAHPAFAGIEFVFKDFTKDDENDPNPYGTHVLGTLCGRAVDGRRIGVAPGVSRVVLAKVLTKEGSGNSQSVFDGTLWAAREGAQVILVCCGMDFPGSLAQLVGGGWPQKLAAAVTLESYKFSLRLFDSLATICGFDRPCLLIAPSGNESQRDNNSDYVIGTSLPAAATGFLSVAALKRLEGGTLYDIAPFSNRSGDVAAPGVDVESAAAGGGLKSMSGTSMAAPHVAGIAALWAEKLQQSRGRLDTRELAARVRGQADLSMLAPGLGADDVGCGLVQAPRT
jgi:subtilisin family serine protease